MNKISRREIIKTGAYTFFFGAIFGSTLYLAPRLNANRTFIRPPGALEEKKFLATCIKCGQCVQICPYHSLSLLGIDTKNSVGTPYINARQRACYLCDLFPCILACPTGSLNHSISAQNEISMGVAYLKNPHKCLSLLNQYVTKDSIKNILTHSNKNERESNILLELEKYIGKECTICADMCPYVDKQNAIEMVKNEQGRFFPQIKKECVGCGVCEELCPADGDGAIVIIPQKTYEKVYS